MVRIVHLSDIHYGDDFLPWSLLHIRGNGKRPTGAIRRGLTEAIRELSPDFVVMSGDFVNTAAEESFVNAARYMRDLLINAGVDIQRQVLVVPGNHDVGFFGKSADNVKRLRKFRVFLDSFYQDPLPEDRLPRFILQNSDHSLIFLALDTTLKSLRPMAEGEAGKAQLMWARQELEEAQRLTGAAFDRCVKIAIMHHHCISIANQNVQQDRNMQLLDAGDVLAFLKERQFDVVLHGHRHVPHASEVRRGDGAVMAVVGAGTVLAPYPDQQGTFGNNFNVIDIDQSALALTVKRYDARSDGTFVSEVEKKFPLGRPLHNEFVTKRLRRFLRIAANGDTEIQSERQGIKVVGEGRLRRLPIRFSRDNPEASIGGFTVYESGGASFEFPIRNEEIYDGAAVFLQTRTSADPAVTLHYGYVIRKGTQMSVAQRLAGGAREQGPLFEQGALSIATDVDELQFDLEFPKDYSVQPRVVFEKNGEELTESVFRGKYDLTYDNFSNRWTMVMRNPPLQHGIFLRWDLPKAWAQS